MVICVQMVATMLRDDNISEDIQQRVSYPAIYKWKDIES